MRIRGTGAGRKTRRSLQRGGTGAAGELNAQLGSWPRVRITPMFGRWGYFVGDQLFACFPLRTKDTDLWIRLPPAEQKRALLVPGFTPHRRFAARGWVECDGGDLARRRSRHSLAAAQLRRRHPVGGAGGAPVALRSAGMAAGASVAARAWASMRSTSRSGTSTHASAVTAAEIHTSGV